jgi:hypothetical protein
LSPAEVLFLLEYQILETKSDSTTTLTLTYEPHRFWHRHLKADDRDKAAAKDSFIKGAGNAESLFFVDESKDQDSFAAVKIRYEIDTLTK